MLNSLLPLNRQTFWTAHWQRFIITFINKVIKVRKCTETTSGLSNMLTFIENLEKVFLFLLMEAVQQTRPLIFPKRFIFPAGVETEAFFVLWVLPHFFRSNSLSSGSAREAFKCAMVRPVLKHLSLTRRFHLILDMSPSRRKGLKEFWERNWKLNCTEPAQLETVDLILSVSFGWPSQQPLTLDQSGLMYHLLEDVGILQWFQSSKTTRTFPVVIGYFSLLSHSRLQSAAEFYSCLLF